MRFLSMAIFTHRSAALVFRTLYPWLYEVFAKDSYSHGYSVQNIRTALQ